MSLTVTSRVENDIAILDLEGSLRLGPSLHSLRETARQVLNRSHPSGLILQMGRLAAVDSAGLGELTVVYTYASRQSCRLALVEVSQNLRTMLEVTHLDGLLPVATNVAAAKALFGASSGAANAG
ncbi:MAG: STAS domain-containing protein [Acidobacteriaceae bacterium]|nr:STAS domain-containing protein [Acidobacteriaceae bacterium]